MTIYQRYLVEFFINIGLTNVKSHQKEIPSTILRSQKEIIAEFLKSLYEWDGGVVYRQDKRHGGECICIDYDSKSNKLIKQLKILLLNFGIATAKPIRDKRNECMKLEINGQNNCYIFKNTINFFSEHKRSILSKIDGINNNRMSKNDFVPFLNDYLRANYPQTFIKKHNLDRYNKLQLNY
ncbi:MAG TPA: LAGLIDADG family homing endonuclease [Candidatus Paceibacterota bacterium]|nr:LAGLIDADG family homing endonuclease [Candidatus Paceibacterota bacterium]HRZ29246.1 LAGLIDADG family homing endonuclease [Candidatus Paceibacterota bacterium]